MMKQPKSRPLPRPTPLSQPYWDAAGQGHLAIQRCQTCKTYYHPPVAQCTNCIRHGGSTLSFERVSGRGKVYSYTVIRDTRIKGFEDVLPYTVVLIELDEAPGLIHYGNMAETDAKDIQIGAPVEVMFMAIGDGIQLPDFCLAVSVAGRR